MPEPRIQYARTNDNMQIAYWTAGEGAVLVNCILPISHLQREWQIPGMSSVYSAAARRWRFARYDHRGFGLSDRDVTDFSLGTLVQDLAAVVERLTDGPIRLFAIDMAVTVALAFAVHYPDRVSHLVLMNGSDRGVDIGNSTIDAIDLLTTHDWQFASEAILRALLGWENEQVARMAAFTLRESVHPAQFRALLQQVRSWNVSADLGSVAAKTLVVQHATHPYLALDTARRLAATLRHAHLFLVDSVFTWAPDRLTMQRIDEFLDDRDPSPQHRADEPTHSLVVVLFADIVDSTLLTERLGDATFRRKAQALDAALRHSIAAERGRVIEGKLLGDGVMATFTAASDGIAAALACAALGEAQGLPLHVGLHGGDVLPQGNDVYGGVVNIAARVSALSSPGEVLVSEVVRMAARTSTSIQFVPKGKKRLKGVSEPYQLYVARRQ